LFPRLFFLCLSLPLFLVSRSLHRRRADCSIATKDEREGSGEDSVAHPARSFGRFKRHFRPEPSSMVSMD
jgi:hypothetical protein